MKPATPSTLRWKAEQDSDGSISYWAFAKRPHNACFCISVRPPASSLARHRRLELTSWIGPDDTPLIERTVKVPVSCPLDKVLGEIGIWQAQLIRETADTLDARARYVRALLD